MSGFIGGIMGGAGSLGGLLAQLLGAAEGATGGGLPALLAQLENAGFGVHVRSWSGPEENLPVTAAEIEAALPAEQLAGWAGQVHVSPAELSTLLAEILPHLVARSTEHGRTTPPVDTV